MPIAFVHVADQRQQVISAHAKAAGTPLAIQNATSGADTGLQMPMLMWISIAAAVVLAMSMVLGLGLAAVLRAVGREVDELLDSELWTLAPTMRTNAPRATGPREYGPKTHA